MSCLRGAPRRARFRSRADQTTQTGGRLFVTNRNRVAVVTARAFKLAFVETCLVPRLDINEPHLGTAFKARGMQGEQNRSERALGEPHGQVLPNHSLKTRTLPLCRQPDRSNN